MVKRRLLILVFLATGVTQLAAQDINEDLMEAVRRSDAAQVEALIAKGANVNATWRYGETPLFFACDRGFTPVVKVLLEHGAEVNIRDTFYGMTPVARAEDKDHVDIVKMLLAKGANADGVLTSGAEDGKLDVVKAALDTGRVKKESLSWALSAATGRSIPRWPSCLRPPVLRPCRQPITWWTPKRSRATPGAIRAAAAVPRWRSASRSRMVSWSRRNPGASSLSLPSARPASAASNTRESTSSSKWKTAR